MQRALQQRPLDEAARLKTVGGSEECAAVGLFKRSLECPPALDEPPAVAETRGKSFTISLILLALWRAV